MTIENPPPGHHLLMVMAFILDGIVVYGFVFSLLAIRATTRPVCTCDREDT